MLMPVVVLFVLPLHSVMGEHITDSPSAYLPCFVDNDKYAVELFGPHMGQILHASSTYAMGTGELPRALHSADNLRTWGTAAGWMTESWGDVVETVKMVFAGGRTVQGEDEGEEEEEEQSGSRGGGGGGGGGVALLQRVAFMNWGAGRYQVEA